MADPQATAERRGPARAPFASLAPWLLLAIAWGVAALVWATVGAPLPGGRWTAVHLLTLGTVSTLIVAMTDHFARTLTRAPGHGARGWRLGVLTAGTVLVVVGLAQGPLWLLGVGATLAVVAVAWSQVVLARLRRQALGDRFAGVVRAYERACLLFVVGGILGALLGLGLLPGAWASGARLAHLAATTLGWGLLTVLATLVFFGPTVMRTQIEPGAEGLAAPALRWAPLALLAAVAGLALTGLPGAWSAAATGLAAVALAGFAVAATVICLPVLSASRRAVPSPQASMLAASCRWLIVVVWAAVIVVLVDDPAVTEVLGVALLLGVLAQVIVGSVSYLLPMALGAGPRPRARIRERLERLPRTRVWALNLGTGALVAAVAIPAGNPVPAAPFALVGWALWALALGATLALVGHAWGTRHREAVA